MGRLHGELRGTWVPDPHRRGSGMALCPSDPGIVFI